MATRANTHNRPKAVRKEPLTNEQYDASVMPADPLRRLGFLHAQEFRRAKGLMIRRILDSFVRRKDDQNQNV